MFDKYDLWHLGKCLTGRCSNIVQPLLLFGEMFLLDNSDKKRRFQEIDNEHKMYHKSRKYGLLNLDICHLDRHLNIGLVPEMI